MPDEKRIKDFEPATNLLIDDWIAVDSPSQGTRKMQKSMFMADEIASLQTLSTAMGNAQIDIGNLQTRAGMSQNLNFGDNLTDGVNILSVLLGAEPYVNTRTYAVGEYCIYEKQLYKCTTAVTSAEDFDSEKWTLTNVKTELTELNSSLNYINYPIKRANNKSLGLDFLGFGAQIDSSRVLVIIPFPFIMNDTNYSISIDGGCNLIGIASIDKTQVSIDTKKQTGVRLIVPYTGTVRQGYAVQIPMTITY